VNERESKQRKKSRGRRAEEEEQRKKSRLSRAESKRACEDDERFSFLLGCLATTYLFLWCLSSWERSYLVAAVTRACSLAAWRRNSMGCMSIRTEKLLPSSKHDLG
jgi:Na+/H+ antiporter NhaD/arsenite permease-like protein